MWQTLVDIFVSESLELKNVFFTNGLSVCVSIRSAREETNQLIPIEFATNLSTGYEKGFDSRSLFGQKTSKKKFFI